MEEAVSVAQKLRDAHAWAAAGVEPYTSLGAELIAVVEAAEMAIDGAEWCWSDLQDALAALDRKLGDAA